jgi:3-oxoacyl-[acyl-carrier protein] reductase
MHLSNSVASPLADRTAIITGASGEAAAAIAPALVSLGAAIVLNHRGNRPDRVQALLDTLTAGDARASVISADTAQASGAAALFDEAEHRHGRIDIVVHTPGRVLKGPIAAVSDADYEAVLDANCRSAFYVLREAANRLANNGRVIMLSTSITAVTIPHYGVYAGSKAAVEHYVRAAARELGPRGVTVNAVAPGPIDSRFYHDAETVESAQYAARLSVANRLGRWDDIAPLVAFLTTSDAQWITGQTIRANGGMAA